MTNIKNKRIILLLIFSLTISMNCVDAGKVKKLEGLSIHDIVGGKRWTEKDVNEFLRLPYNKTFSNSRLIISNDKFNDFYGIEDFALITKVEKNRPLNEKNSLWINFKMSSLDLSMFSVSINTPDSCQSACRHIRNAVSRISVYSKMPEVYIPLQKSQDVYTLLDKTNPPRKWYLNTSLGIYIYVCYEPSSKWIKEKSPDHALLIKQIDLIINGMVSFLEGKYIITDKQKEYYEEIIQVYNKQQNIHKKKVKWKKAEPRDTEIKNNKLSEGILNPAYIDSIIPVRRVILTAKDITKLNIKDNFYRNALKYNKQGEFIVALSCLEQEVKSTQNKNYLRACLMLSDYYYESRRGIPINRAKAKKYLKIVLGNINNTTFSEAEKEYIQAVYDLRFMGRNKMTLALKLLEKSAKSEYLPAVRELVFWQFRRYRKKWKIQELMKWAEVGSARGDMLSKAILGVYYIREKKIHEGLKLIFVSAKSGNPAGQYALQECIKNKLVKGTEAQVQQLLTASADQGFYYATAFGN